MNFVCNKKTKVLLKPITRMCCKGCNIFISTIDFLFLEHIIDASSTIESVHSETVSHLPGKKSNLKASMVCATKPKAYMNMSIRQNVSSSGFTLAVIASKTCVRVQGAHGTQVVQGVQGRTR